MTDELVTFGDVTASPISGDVICEGMRLIDLSQWAVMEYTHGGKPAVVTVLYLKAHEWYVGEFADDVTGERRLGTFKKSGWGLVVDPASIPVVTDTKVVSVRDKVKAAYGL